MASLLSDEFTAGTPNAGAAGNKKRRKPRKKTAKRNTAPVAAAPNKRRKRKPAKRNTTAVANKPRRNKTHASTISGKKIVIRPRAHGRLQATHNRKHRRRRSGATRNPIGNFMSVLPRVAVLGISSLATSLLVKFGAGYGAGWLGGTANKHQKDWALVTQSDGSAKWVEGDGGGGKVLQRISKGDYNPTVEEFETYEKYRKGIGAGLGLITGFLGTWLATSSSKSMLADVGTGMAIGGIKEVITNLIAFGLDQPLESYTHPAGFRTTETLIQTPGGAGLMAGADPSVGLGRARYRHHRYLHGADMPQVGGADQPAIGYARPLPMIHGANDPSVGAFYGAAPKPESVLTDREIQAIVKEAAMHGNEGNPYSFSEPLSGDSGFYGDDEMYGDYDNLLGDDSIHYDSPPPMDNLRQIFGMQMQGAEQPAIG